MTNYERDDTIPVQSDGTLSFSDIATLLPHDVEYLEASDLSRHSPTQGRVAKELTSREFYIGDGTDWQLATDFIRGQFPSLAAKEASLAGRRTISPGHDIQAILDEYDSKDVTIYLSRGTEAGGGMYERTSPLTVGESTVIEGEVANKRILGEKSFQPRPTVRITSDVAGMNIEPSTEWPQCCVFRDFRLEGPGADTSTATGLDIGGQYGTRNETADLFEFERMWIAEFDTLYDGGSQTDSMRFEKVAFNDATYAIVGAGQTNKFIDCIFARISGSPAIHFNGVKCGLYNCEIETVNPNDIVQVDTDGREAKIMHNSFKHDMGEAIGIDAPNCVVADNNVDGTGMLRFVRIGTSGAGKVANSILDNTIRGDLDANASDVVNIEGGNNIVAYNNFNRLNASNAGNVIDIHGDHNVIAGNMMPATPPANNDVIVRAGSVENFLYGFFPNGIGNFGTRTIINGNSVNSGNPATTGDWNTFANFAFRHNVVVWDTSVTPQQPYRATPNGSWVSLTVASA